MRIQHNIMAMGAYRNYTNNLSAMKKNLEKLSSGYKINRAGDDAAGLAISEKMRAQITGLETAQKNAKDGISLVQTAEGALTEVHDMLNRMVELATQSANGTYDNETDRLQLQKEVAQLTDEINRIADSSNFNGIKLLDGSMDGSPIAGELKNILAGAAGSTNPFLPLAGAGQVLGVDTVLHKGSSDVKTAQFGVSLHNVTYSNDDANGNMTITFGNDQIRISGGGSKAELDTGDLVTTLGTAGSNPRDMTVGTQTYTVEGDTLEDQLNSWVEQFNNDTTANTNMTASVVDGSKIKFEALNAGATTANGGSGTSAADADAIDTLAAGLANSTSVAGVDGVKHKVVANVTLDTTSGALADGDTISVGGTTYVLVDDIDNPNAGITIPAGAEKVLTTDVNETWVANKVRDAIGSLDGLGFAAPSNPATAASGTGSSFTYEALEEGKFTGTLPTMPTVSITSANGVTLAASWDSTDTDNVTGVDAVKASVTSDIQTKKTGELEIAGFKTTVSSADPREQLEEFMTAYNGTASNKYVASWNDDGNGIKFTAKNEGELNGGNAITAGTNNAGTFQFQATGTDGGSSALGKDGVLSAKDILDAVMAGKAKISTDNGASFDTLTTADIANGITLSDGVTYTISAKDDTLTFTQIESDTDNSGALKQATLDREVTINSTVSAATGNKMAQGDYQKSTTFNTPNDNAAENRLASTYFTMTADNVVDGGSIFIGGKNYQFTTDKDAADKDSTKVYFGDLVDSNTGKMSANAADIKKLNERITVAAKDNEVYTVGYDEGRLTFTERVGYTTGDQEYDLTKLSEIERSLGFTAADTPSEGKSLTLQIGDTAEDFNQLKVNIKDMHAKSLGLEGLDISTQDGAAAAVDKIKAAINTVSDVRGTLGATQNRLDHTINNLSVMTENIQDAESTIRDTDVAEEMMAYTKNNILIQSAQAMLAQANQVPQGVLQLLG